MAVPYDEATYTCSISVQRASQTIAAQGPVIGNQNADQTLHIITSLAIIGISVGLLKGEALRWPRTEPSLSSTERRTPRRGLFASSASSISYVGPASARRGASAPRPPARSSCCAHTRRLVSVQPGGAGEKRRGTQSVAHRHAFPAEEQSKHAAGLRNQADVHLAGAVQMRFAGCPKALLQAHQMKGHARRYRREDVQVKLRVDLGAVAPTSARRALMPDVRRNMPGLCRGPPCV